MEDENSLELSLGLFCGSSSNKTKDNASELKIAGGDTKEQLVGSLNVADSSLSPFYTSNVDSSCLGGQQGCENFWKDLGQQTATGVEEAGPRYRQMWGLDGTTFPAEDKLGQNKRKMPFEDVNILKKPEMGKEVVAHQSGGIKSHISVNSEDCSSAENEAVGESENEASNTWLMSQHKDVANGSQTHHFGGNKVPKNRDHHVSQGKGSSSVMIHGPKMDHGSSSYGVLPLGGAGTAVPVKSPNPGSAGNALGTHLSSTIQSTPVLAADEPSITHAVKSNTLHLSSFGYQPNQLPTLETSSSWILGPLLDRNVTTDAPPNSSHSEDRMKAFQGQGRTPDPSKGSGKGTEDVGTPPFQQEESDGSKQGFVPKLSPTEPPPQQIEGFPGQGSMIRPGIAPGLKFGGCGSYPDLPWVSVTGSEPNGKTISGVTYKFSKNHIKIVCACHGSHMSPEEFIRHANVDNPDADANAGGLGGAPPLNGNPAASARS